MLRNASAVCGLWILILANFASLSAQVVDATLTGIITDPTGATVAGAKVDATNTGTNLSHEAVSDSSGVYTIPALTPGVYRLEVAQPGFKKQVLSGIVLQVAQEARINVALQVGEVSESVTVASAAPLVNSENATVGSVISEQRVLDMPLNGRNFSCNLLFSRVGSPKVVRATPKDPFSTRASLRPPLGCPRRRIIIC